MQKKHILFVYVNFSSFVKADFGILSEFANVSKYEFKPGKGIVSTVIKLLKQFLFLITNIWRYDSVFVWFADYHSLLPVLIARIFGKKSFVVIGGYEVARIKSLNYGALCSEIRAFFCVSSIKLSTLNLTVSGYVDRKVKYIAPGSKRQLVPNCIDLTDLPDLDTAKADVILTVGLIENQRTYYLKGIDTFIDVARKMPDYQFIIIGLDQSRVSGLLTDIPMNLTIMGRVSHSELPAFYKNSKFYCQLSRSESFGVSVAEAMYYGCVPIVTNEGGLPELTGRSGYIVKRNPEDIALLIRECSQILPEYKQALSNRVKSGYSRKKRAETIKGLFD